MTLESIERLRESLSDCTTEAGVEPNRFDTYWITARACDILIDEIEREIAEKYIELPVDADGVLIRIGDTVREVDDCVPMKVMSLTFYEDCVDVNACGMNPNLLLHVKPRTVEDVLADVVTLCANTWKDGESPFAFYDVWDVMESGNIREYADELREMAKEDGDD